MHVLDTHLVQPMPTEKSSKLGGSQKERKIPRAASVGYAEESTKSPELRRTQSEPASIRFSGVYCIQCYFKSGCCDKPTKVGMFDFGWEEGQCKNPPCLYKTYVAPHTLKKATKDGWYPQDKFGAKWVAEVTALKK